MPTRAVVATLLTVAKDVVVTLAVLFAADPAIVDQCPALTAIASVVTLVAFAADEQGRETDEENKKGT